MRKLLFVLAGGKKLLVWYVSMDMSHFKKQKFTQKVDFLGLERNYN